MSQVSMLRELFSSNEGTILDAWINEQLNSTAVRRDLISEAKLKQESAEFLSLIVKAINVCDSVDIEASEWVDTRNYLKALSRSRAITGFSPTETATFVFSLKQPVFACIQQVFGVDPTALVEIQRTTTFLIDKLGLFTTDAFILGREEVIKRQQQEMIELSTPVVKVWDGILVLPLIGTLDSARTQVVMETLLQTIVDTGSEVAIIDITGVPAVDTLVAQHLIKTVTAARFMGAQCLISGIRPQIAQTMVYLGVAFGDVVTKASLSDALAYAFRLQGLSVIKVQD